jgi:hypothetical protein
MSAQVTRSNYHPQIVDYLFAGEYRAAAFSKKAESSRACSLDRLAKISLETTVHLASRIRSSGLKGSHPSIESGDSYEHT